MDTKDRIQLFKSDVDGWLVDGILPRAIVIVLGLYLLLVIVLGVIWTGEPEVTDVRLVTEDYSARESRGIVPGSFTTATLIYIAETLLDKQGGFL